MLLVAKRSARHARVKALVQMRHLVITAPDELQHRLKGLTTYRLINACSRLRADRSSDPVVANAKVALSSLAHRILSLEREIADLEARILVLVEQTAPELLARFGVGLDTAAALLVAAGDNPERLHSEAAFAHLCGVSPIPASSGKTNGHVQIILGHWGDLLCRVFAGNVEIHSGGPVRGGPSVRFTPTHGTPTPLR
jgi:transposase